MSELTNTCETSLSAQVSNEHILFAGTLRDWSDPLLQGHKPTSASLCPRCAICRCESLRDLPNVLTSSNHRHSHHHQHNPSCPNFRRHERAKTSSRQRLINKPKRRANSCDSSIPLNSHTSLIKQKAQHSPSPPPSTNPTKRKKPISKIPVRISSATSSSTVTTTASEYSPSSSIAEHPSINIKVKIPRPISNQNLPSTTNFSHTNRILPSDEDIEQDR